MSATHLVHTKESVSDKDFNLELLGGKAFNLLKMASFKAVKVPPFFVIPTGLYRELIETGSTPTIQKMIAGLNKAKLGEIQKNTALIRRFFLDAPLPMKWQEEIVNNYRHLNHLQNPLVAVRSSATCEDLEGASFAGQQDTYLNVNGQKQLLNSVKKCLASLFTVRAVVYRNNQKIKHIKAALSIVVQEMINPKVSGVAFSVDPLSGFDGAVRIDASFGLGEAIVQGMVSPDTFLITKAQAVFLEKELGAKEKMVVYVKGGGTKTVDTPPGLSRSWAMSETTARGLAATVQAIEKYYGHLVDVEFAVDHNDNLWILQVRPETKWQGIREKNPNLIPFSRTKIANNVNEKPTMVGLGVSPGAGCGRAVFLDDGEPLSKVKQGDILLAKRTDPDMVPAMQVAAAVVTAVGGRTSHAAIVSRELGIPAVVGTEKLSELKALSGKMITVDGDGGFVYDRSLALVKDDRDIDTAKLPQTRTRVGLILAEPNQALRLSKLSLNEFEVGLLRAEFVLGRIAVHPQALDEFDKGILKKKSLQVYDQVRELLSSRGYRSGKLYFIEFLARGIALFAHAFPGRPVIYRTTDFKTNEYKNQLIGGDLYEPNEDNPMIGNRGTGRYLMGENLRYLGWEIEALDLARTKYQGANLELMLPFVRTLTEAKLALKFVKSKVKSKNIKTIAMSEIPANALLATEFIKLFDGFSIGSNDMTQLVLGTDRDNQALQKTYDEHDPAVVKAILATIFAGLKAGKKVGFCGQGVSDSVIIAGLVAIAGITSASVVPDRYQQTKELLAKLEKQKIKVKDLGHWLNKQFKARKNKTEKDKIYAELNWEEIVLSALNLGGISGYKEAQQLIDKHA
jgi:pyruvate,water dikinase